VLRKRKVSLSDSGTFVCEARNVVGKTRQEVVIKGKLEFYCSWKSASTDVHRLLYTINTCWFHISNLVQLSKQNLLHYKPFLKNVFFLFSNYNKLRVQQNERESNSRLMIGRLATRPFLIRLGTRLFLINNLLSKIVSMEVQSWLTTYI